MPVLSILMPVYNEDRTVEQAILGVVNTNWPVEIELIVVDDGSSDGTGAVLDAGEWPRNVRVFTHDVNRGKGAAIRTALAQARGEFSGIFDADLECDPNDLGRLLEPLLAGRANVTFGARVFGEETKHSMVLLLGNRGVTFVTRLLFGGRVSDMMTAQKVMRTELFRGLPLREDRFGIEPEITARLLQRHEQIIELPVAYIARTKAQGKKIAARDGWRVLRTLLRCRFSGS
jgi:glycosyltransferase involved in cell wall biosynthesis